MTGSPLGSALRCGGTSIFRLYSIDSTPSFVGLFRLLWFFSIGVPFARVVRAAHMIRQYRPRSIMAHRSLLTIRFACHVPGIAANTGTLRDPAAQSR
jgi:hypothetical protein